MPGIVSILVIYRPFRIRIRTHQPQDQTPFRQLVRISVAPWQTDHSLKDEQRILWNPEPLSHHQGSGKATTNPGKSIAGVANLDITQIFSFLEPPASQASLRLGVNMIFDLENEDEEEDDDIWWARAIDFHHIITLEGRSYAFYTVPNVVQSSLGDTNNALKGIDCPCLSISSSTLTLELQSKHHSFLLRNIWGLGCAALTAP
jgi:hypothetical protein